MVSGRVSGAESTKRSAMILLNGGARLEGPDGLLLLLVLMAQAASKSLHYSTRLKRLKTKWIRFGKCTQKLSLGIC